MGISTNRTEVRIRDYHSDNHYVEVLEGTTESFIDQYGKPERGVERPTCLGHSRCNLADHVLPKGGEWIHAFNIDII